MNQSLEERKQSKEAPGKITVASRKKKKEGIFRVFLGFLQERNKTTEEGMGKKRGIPAERKGGRVVVR